MDTVKKLIDTQTEANVMLAFHIAEQNNYDIESYLNEEYLLDFIHAKHEKYYPSWLKVSTHQDIVAVNIL